MSKKETLQHFEIRETGFLVSVFHLMSWLINWTKKKRSRTDSWYLVKKIFGDPRNFGGSDPTNESTYSKFQIRHVQIEGPALSDYKLLFKFVYLNFRSSIETILVTDSRLSCFLILSLSIIPDFQPSSVSTKVL